MSSQAPKKSPGESQPLMQAEEGMSSRVAETKPGSQVAANLKRQLTAAKEQMYEASDQAELQSDLEHMHQNAVGEDDLNVMPWYDLGVEFARNSIPSVLLIGFLLFLIRITPPLFLGLGIKPAVFTVLTVLFAMFISFGVELLQMGMNDTSYDLPFGKRILKTSPLLQAILGKKILKLSSRSEVYMFAQCLERRANAPGAFVELVVNPENPSETQKVLTISGEEVMPSRWKCVSVYNSERDYTEELQTAATGELYPTLAQVMTTWVVKDPAFGVPCYAELVPVTRQLHLELAFDHWAVRMIISMVMLVILLMPGWEYLKIMRTLRFHYCKKGDTKVLPVCGPDEDGNTCEKACSTLLEFIGEAGKRLGVEEIEHIWTLSLGLVSIYLFSLSYIWRQRSVLETKYILRMNNMTKASRVEVMQVRKLLLESLSPCGVFQGLYRQCQALSLPIKACEPLTIDLLSGPSKIMNPWFWKVMEHVRDTNLRQATPYPISLPISDKEHSKTDVKGASGDLVTWEEKMNAMSRSLMKMKNMHGLSRKKSQSEKKFKFCLSVPVTCRESLQILKTEFFTKTGPKGYASQLDAIFSRKDCQDDPGSQADKETANFCHVMEDFRAGPLLIPAGFCLTHVACKTADDDLLSLEVGKDKDISTREAFMLFFSGKDNPKLNNSLVLDRLGEKYQWPSIMLPSASYQTSSSSKELRPVDSADLEAKMKDTFIYRLYFIFQLSPAYFEALQQTDKGSDGSLYSFCEGMCENLKSSPAEEPTTSMIVTIKKQSWQDTEGSQFCLVTEINKSATWSKILGLCKRLMEIMWFVFVSAVFVLIVPFWRYFRWGGSLFPEPFTYWLVLNEIVKFVALAWYLSNFSFASSRLSAVAKALYAFETSTLDSCQGGSKKKADPDSKRTEEDPFALSISADEDLDLGNKAWTAMWSAKEKALANWHLCCRHMRILMSGARLTSQAILVGAAAILGFMLLVDVWQGLHGTGSLVINKENLFKKFQEETMESIKGVVTEAEKKGASVTESLAKSAVAVGEKAAGAEFGRRLLDNGDGAAFHLQNATQALMHSLSPFSAAVDRVHERQLLDLAKQWDRAQKFVQIDDVQQITQAQLLTICMTLLLLGYSCVLLYRIAEINEQMTTQENLLVQVKENHCHGVALRQAASEKKDPSPAEAGEKARESYERMLDMTIEAAQMHKERSAFRLFTVVITEALLIVWVCTLAQPMVQKVTEAAPVMLDQFCHWIGDSQVGQLVEGKAEELEKNLAGEVLNYKVGEQENMFYALVCAPLLEIDTAEVEALKGKVEEGKTAADEARRLAEDEHMLSHHAITPLVEDWWDSNPGNPQAKLALVQTVLQERAHSVRKLLLAGPEAMRKAALSRRAGSAAAPSRSWWPRRLLQGPAGGPGEL